MNEKIVFGMYAMAVVAALQMIAWYSGANGQVFALTSLVIGGVVGSLLGFSVTKKAGK